MIEPDGDDCCSISLDELIKYQYPSVIAVLAAHNAAKATSRKAFYQDGYNEKVGLTEHQYIPPICALLLLFALFGLDPHTIVL